MKPNEKILIGDFLGTKILVPYYAAATGGSFSGNINSGYAKVRELDKIRVFYEFSKRFKNPIFFDIGACYGTYSFITLLNPELRVEAFEPYPVMIEYMKDIILLNDIPNITINEFGLSNEDRQCDMRFGSVFRRAKLNFNVGTSRIKTDKPGDFVFKTLDSLNYEKVDLIKIDVEDHEMEVFEGAEKTLKRCKPKYIQVEMHNNKKDRDERINLIMNKYLENDYICTQYYEKFDSDYLFTRKDIAKIPKGNNLF